MADYKESHTQFAEWRKLTGKLKPPMLFRVEFAGFLLEAYNDHNGTMVLIQVFDNGRGFKIYTANPEYITNLDLNSLRH